MTAATLSESPPRSDDTFVELENVTLTYGRGDKQIVALGQTDLRIDQGDFVALVGPSGCGKSTILKLVTGLAATRPAATSMSPAARSAPSRCASAWRSRTRPCCRG